MQGMLEEKQLITHKIQTSDLSSQLTEIQQKIIARGDLSYVTVDEQLNILHKLCEFELGKFLILNKGLNGYWTHYILNYQPQNLKYQNLTSLETNLLARFPAVLATRQRLKIFLEQNQECVKEQANLASIPCGLMNDLLELDYSGVDFISLYGFDLDNESLEKVKDYAYSKDFEKGIILKKQDAWQMRERDYFDLISSNGLSIYEQDDNKVQNLFNKFYAALKAGGKLVTSTLTFPPNGQEPCEWLMENINQNDLRQQIIVFKDVIGVNWSAFRSTFQMVNMLKEVGFSSTQVLFDQARIFPTIVAIK